jgi:hypothetical protein
MLKFGGCGVKTFLYIRECAGLNRNILVFKVTIFQPTCDHRLYCPETDIFNDIGGVVRVAESKSDIEHFLTVINLLASD